LAPKKNRNSAIAPADIRTRAMRVFGVDLLVSLSFLSVRTWVATSYATDSACFSQELGPIEPPARPGSAKRGPRRIVPLILPAPQEAL
jgi:hypothetical protein